MIGMESKYIPSGLLFESSPRKRDELLIKTFNFTQPELNRIRSKYPPIEAIRSAVSKLYEKTEDPLTLTQHNISAISSHEWEGRKTNRKSSMTISKHYAEERDRRIINTGLKLTNMHLLREEIGAYFGNLEEAKRRWKKLNPGPNDWLRSVKIPQHIGYKESQLLGVYWGHGCKSGSYTLRLGAGEDDYRFYDFFVKKRIKDMHNLDVEVKSIEREDGPDSTRIDLTSKVVMSWLVEELGFPVTADKVNIDLPTINYDKQGFFEGVISAGNNVGGRLYFADKDKKFIDNIEKLSNDLGHEPLYQEKPCGSVNPQYTLFFSQRQARRIRLLNPNHLL